VNYVVSLDAVCLPDQNGLTISIFEQMGNNIIPKILQVADEDLSILRLGRGMVSKELQDVE